MSDINQDDIDKLLQDALVDGGGADAPEPGSAAEQELTGPATQDDIDALFAAVGPDDGALPAGDAHPADASGDASESDEPELDLDGIASQDDIDSLFSSVGGAVEDSPAPEAETGPSALAAETADPLADEGGVADQDDIDALFSAVNAAETEAAASESEEESETVSDFAEKLGRPNNSTEVFESELAEAEAAADQAEHAAESDLNALLSSIVDDDAAAAAEPAAAPEPPTDEASADGDTDEADGDIDIDALLQEVSAAVPPPPARPLETENQPADTAILSPDVSSALAQAGLNAGAGAGPDASAGPDITDTDTVSVPAETAPPLPPPPPPPAGVAASGTRREFSVLYGAGEVDSVANQINSLLGSMSEKAHGYMHAWIAADSEAKELRARALGEERRRASLESEKAALAGEVEDLRSRLSELEGVRIAGEESRRTLEASSQAKVRELERQVTLLSSEAESLKDELTRARNQATGVDIESRRARFEVDRLKNEVESERMERLRIQRALENREKEIQAMQSQASGQASSLFIDELHRLVRRLESELDSRTSGAHEALRQLDRIDVPEEMVPAAANLRAALMQALGRDSDADDALKSLGREAGGIAGASAVAPHKAEMVSFESALSTYNLVGAVDVAGTLLREASATPPSLMRKVYQCPALRRPEVGDHLADLSRLLEGLRTVQEANDRSRGSESAESEVFYVHMFDFLHNLVRLKLVNRMSGDIWRLFLDLRGRFSFVTSDKQWAEYRDNTLRDKGAR